MGDSLNNDQAGLGAAVSSSVSRLSLEEKPAEAAPASPRHWTVPDGDVSPSSSSSMTTKELQEYWRAVKSQRKPVKLLFKIPSTRTVEHYPSRYVMYKIVIIKSGSYDYKTVSIERRYTDFERLHQNLLKDFSEELEDLLFPRKRLTCNFTQENINERRMAFQEYLGTLYGMKCIRRSGTFVAFFTHPELKEAHACLRGGQYAKALGLLLEIKDLHEKLTQHSPALRVPTLCALLVCYKDLEDITSACQVGEEALSLLARNKRHRYKCALLDTLVDLGYELGHDVTHLQEELSEIKEAQKMQTAQLSLKELVVQEFVD
ncbi:sorting nexin-20-like [Polyodon spathula]|uniref:sorting nexin-20-like n=1 Tax=Polyodon spathula TaxID=7913 RepID=UPI001B7E2D8B|nr:sorting nexin-20-like [Polyodon spathula]XP_041078346.1 sorting nexin-20-like [Polyodon spathula]